MTRIVGPTGSRRRRRFLIAPILLVAACALFFTAGAQAVHDLKFELDGNVATDGSTPFNTGTVDWASFFDASGNELALPPDFTASGFDPDFSTNPNGSFSTSDPTTYATGSKDTLPISGWQCNFDHNVNSKIDVMNAYAAAYTDPGSGDQIVYFALERNFNSGDANVGFWFLQEDVGCDASAGTATFTGAHADGDLLIVSAFTNGGTVSTIDVYRWNGGASGSLGSTPVAHGVDCRSATTPLGDPACAASNTSPITTPWLTSTKQDGVGHSLLTSDFFEGGLNLSDSGLGGKCFNVFIGDTRSSQSLTATLFDFARGKIGECTSETVTTPSVSGSATIPASGTLSVTDSATVTVNGVASFSGSVTFHLCGPFTASATTRCESGGVAVGSAKSVTSSPTTVSSDPATITSAGRYCWRADFSGDAAKGVPSSSDSRESECFLINPRQPTLSTQAVDADGTAISAAVPFGSTIYDTATLGNTANKPGSGGPAGSTNGSIDPATAGGAATGTITFKLYGPGTDTTACNTLATGFPAAGIVVNVSGDNTYGGAGSTPPVSFVPQSPGVYHWKADYSGDLPNTLSASHNSGCTDTNEDVTVQRIDTEILTNQSVYPNDSATITSALASDNLPATGTVIFRLYDNATCTDDDDVIGATGLLYKETKTGVGGSHSVTVGTNNTTIAVSADGTVYWKVTYATGDQAHTGRQSDCIENTTLAFVNDAGPGTLFP